MTGRYLSRTVLPTVLIYVGLAIGLVFAVFPILWMLFASFKSNTEIFALPPQLLPKHFTIAAYLSVFNDPTKIRFFFNSYLVAGAVAVLTVLIGILAAYAFSRFSFRLKNPLNVFIISTQTVPPITLLIPYFGMVVAFGIFNTYFALILTYLVFTLPYAILLMTGYLNTLPRELDEAVLVDGGTSWSALWRVIVPLSVPGIVATAVYTFLLAWNEFLREFRQPMQQAAIAITRSSSAGEELADSLYAELFGLTQRDGVRSSPLASYSGRGPLMGWLRATLAQRHVNHHRRTSREDPLDDDNFPARVTQPPPETHNLIRLSSAVREVLSALAPEDRFLLSAYFLDGHTLLEIATLLGVHEATVSRRIRKLTDTLHKQLVRKLEARGMSRRAAQEALGTDPRDLSVNLRNLLQTSQPFAFSDQEAQRAEQT